MRPLDPSDFDIVDAFHVTGAARYTLPSWESCIRSAMNNRFLRVFQDDHEDRTNLSEEWVDAHHDYHRRGRESTRHTRYKIRAARYLEDLHHTVEKTTHQYDTEEDWLYTGFEVETASVAKRVDVACATCETYVECGEIRPSVVFDAFGFEREGDDLRRTRDTCVDSFITLPYPHQEQSQGANGQWTFFIFNSLDLPDPA